MKRKGKTSQRTILFRQNVNRDNEEWAHFLEGYREWLMDWDMTTYGDDWHTAEDIVSEIYLTIIQEPLIINLRPNDTFRHTLITLCKHAHRDVTKPWRKGLMDRLYEALRPVRRTPDDFKAELALGIADLVEADLMDKTRDRNRPFRTFSLEDLKRWRKFRQAGENAKAKDVAKAMKPAVHPSVFGRSIKKVDTHVVKTVKELLVVSC